MKFKKILSVGIAESQLDKSTWKNIDTLTEKRVSVATDYADIDKELKDTDCLLVYFNKADKEMINKAPNLRYIGALATGVGKIDTLYAVKKKIVVTNVPGYSTESVAEFVFAMLLEHLREITRAKTESRAGNRSELGFSAREIKGKKFGIIGMGRIGMRVAELAKCFGANVTYWSRDRKKEMENQGILYADLDEILRTCDILSVHIALNTSTENLLNEGKIAAIKINTIVINTAPMELMDFTALEKRVKAGEITLIFDHTDVGDITEENLKRLQTYKNCITYPAIGYISDEARVAKQNIFVSNMKSFLQGKPINVVTS